MINRVGGSVNNGNVYAQKIVRESTDSGEVVKNQDSVSISSKNKLSAEEIEKLKEQADAATRNLRELVEKLILKQSKSSSVSSGTNLGSVVPDAETVSEAKAAISEDGYYGVKAVSDRIVSFAKAISGNDASRVEELKSAIIKGFEEAKKTWGGELPGICSQTYDEVMKKLDDWSKESGKVNITA